jgi:hypothetical protein
MVGDRQQRRGGPRPSQSQQYRSPLSPELLPTTSSLLSSTSYLLPTFHAFTHF